MSDQRSVYRIDERPEVFPALAALSSIPYVRVNQHLGGDWNDVAVPPQLPKCNLSDRSFTENPSRRTVFPPGTGIARLSGRAKCRRRPASECGQR